MSRFNSDPQTRELELLRAARAGDASAKRNLEARELSSAADQVVSGLRDKAIAGDPAAMTALRNIRDGKAPTRSSASPAPSGPSQASVDQAVSAAVCREQQRWAKVLRSDAARGKERACVGILTMAENYSADTIIAKLPRISPDAKHDADRRRAELDRAGEGWERVHRAIAEGPSGYRRAGQTQDPPKSTAAARWDKVWAKINQERGA